MRFWQAVVASGLILSAGLGLLVMSGTARGLAAPDLQAQLVVQDFPLPPDMGVDPARVADFMAAKLQQRLEDDVAIRLMLPEDPLQKVRDIVLPRLMNVVAVQAMMSEIPELDALLGLGSFRQTVSGEIDSREPAADVALTVPGALLATVDGAVVGIVTTSTGLTALNLGDMAAGQSHHVVVWRADSAAVPDLRRAILLGAADGQRGRVLLGGDRGWFGADIEVLRWGRWIIGSLLVAVLVFGLAAVMLPLLVTRQTRRRRPGTAADLPS
ncbi:MAG: hypothetical protein H3C51_07250 [Rubellimicrobium sp.]|nr:hypothetical protein [Rubellimicrobium sp.]